MKKIYIFFILVAVVFAFVLAENIINKERELNASEIENITIEHVRTFGAVSSYNIFNNNEELTITEVTIEIEGEEFILKTDIKPMMHERSIVRPIQAGSFALISAKGK